MFNWLRTAAFSILLGVIAFGAGCAQERDPINRVQPNVLNKHFFLGADLSDRNDDPQFFWRAYVVDGSASNSLIGIGSWQGIDRVVWEATETQLIARKAYAVVDGQDNKASNADPNAPTSSDAFGRSLVRSQNGTIVASYPIQSHFDIRRSYNPQTGEELNIVEENGSDRPWYQREYMRVDWSRNTVDNPMWEDLFTGRLFGNISAQNSGSSFYSVNDPRNEDAPVLDEAAGYFEVTDKFLITPALTDSPFSDVSGKVPTCVVIGIYTGTASYECDAQEAVVRQSYWRIDPAQHDVEPLENTLADLDVIGNPGGLGSSYIVGIVTPGRQAYDPQYGFTDKLFHRFAHRHNTWQKAHVDLACSSNADADANGTADECEAVNTGSKGSQCDIYSRKCTIPIRDRQIKTVGYWVNRDAPPELQDELDPNGKIMGQRGTLEDLIDSWNQLMRVGLATAREVECRRTGDGDRDACHAKYFSTAQVNGLRDPNSMEAVHHGGWLVETPIALPNDPVYPVGMYPDVPHLKGLQPLTFCHNPVREYDRHDVCGPTGQKARVGDIRKNFIFYWPYDSRAPWGGIANWEADPLTGEIIGGAAQVMGRSATYAAALNRDVLQVAMGDVKIDELINGVQADRFAKTLMNGHGPFDVAVPLEQQQAAIAATDFKNVIETLQLQNKGGTPQQQTFQTLRHMASSVADPRQFSTAQLEYENLISKVRGSKYEAQLVDSGWLVNALGMDPSTEINDAVLNQVSPIRGMDRGRIRAMRDVLEARLDAKGVCFLDHHAPAYGSVAVPALAKYFKDKYPGDPIERGKKIYTEIWKETVKGIALHEIGHSLGMLHQFASSWDAQNYNPQYWQLRTNEGQATVKCNGPRDPKAADTCMGPRYNDPETLDEQGLGEESRPDVMYFGNTSTMEYQFERFLENVGLGTFDLHTMKALYGGVIETVDSRVIPSIAEQRSIGWRSFTQLIDKDLYNGNFVHYTEQARKVKVFDPQRDCRAATQEEKDSGKWRIVHGKVCAPAPRDNWAWRDFPSSSYVYFNNGECKPSNPQCNDGEGGGLSGPYWHAPNVPGAPGGDQGKEYVRWTYKWGVSHNAYYHTNDSDAGADAYEVTLNTIKRFDATYPWTYFRRQNKEYYYRTISSSTADRFFDRLHAYNWLVATNIGRSNNQSANSDDQYKPDLMAQAEMAKMLTRTMTLPEPGGFNVSAAFTPPESTHQIYDVQTNGSSLFSVGVVDGRFINESYSNVLGGSWDYLHWVEHSGFSMEKQRLIESIVDSRPTLFTISRENALDGRNVYINFRTNLPNYTDRLVGGILANDWESIGQYVAGNDTSKVPALIPLDLTAANPTRNDPNAKVIFPNLGYKSQLATGLWVAAYAQLGGDQTLVNKMRVWIDGQVGQVNIPDAQKILMTDPASGYTYVARKYGNDVIDGKTVEAGIASRMLQHANQLIAGAYVVQRDGSNKPILDSFGRPILILDGQGQPQETGVISKTEVGRYVAIIDAVKGIELMLGYSPEFK